MNGNKNITQNNRDPFILKKIIFFLKRLKPNRAPRVEDLRGELLNAIDILLDKCV